MASLFAIVAFCALYTGCNKELVEPIGSASVKIHVSGFTVTQGEIPSAKSSQNVSDYEGVKVIDLAFYEGIDEVGVQDLTVAQRQLDVHPYGEFECELPVGYYAIILKL